MNTFLALWRIWVSHGTKVLGLAQGTIATLAAMDGIIPANHLKYWLAASAVLTFWRGFFNTAKSATTTLETTKP